jgi:hypothetical protein
MNQLKAFNPALAASFMIARLGVGETVFLTKIGYHFIASSSTWQSNGTNQTDYAHAMPSQGRRPPLTPDGGKGGLVYYQDGVPKVATERRWELVMRVSMWVY